jgi:hypothetical protein
MRVHLGVGRHGLWVGRVLGLLCLWVGLGQRVTATPLRVHAANPRYLEFRGKPVLLVGSGEHYGAVVNRDFDFVKYLAAVERDGQNYTRVFSGSYVEPPGAFNIASNTLAPAAGRFVSPWARSDVPGYAGGGTLFDLSRWDPAYFSRLKGFVGEASRRGVVVEFTLFCPMYEDMQWRLSPMNPANHVNGVSGPVGRTNVFTLDRHGGLLPFQEALVRGVVEALKDFDNVILEICNEPYFGGVSLDWQRRIADVIVEAQRDHALPKPIAQNIANGSAIVRDPHPGVSVLNFHYAAPPDAVAANAGLGRVIGDDETGFRGTLDAPYRMEGWDFLMAGGGLFNHLDYSFAVGHEAGTFEYPATQPGGGNAGFRRQMRFMREFIGGLRLGQLEPMSGGVTGEWPAGVSARGLSERDGAVLVYVRTAGLPRQYSARWTGFLTAPATGEFTLYTRSNDGVRLWVDDRLVIDHWDEHSTAEDQAVVRLEKGSRRRLRLEYFYSGGEATMQLEWAGPGVTRQVIPREVLRTFDGKAGLRGEYYADTTLTARSREVVDGPIDFKASDGGSARVPEGSVRMRFALSDGRWKCVWWSPREGRVVREEQVEVRSGEANLVAPGFEDDIVCRLDPVR